jgi:hypothetical protein
VPTQLTGTYLEKANLFEYKTFGASSAEAAAEMYLNVNS